ncbi:MAG: PAS domain S-box protein [Bacteroidia bacterium]|nr:PAS domain S-box protein [Bacteroidia bacterium]
MKLKPDIRSTEALGWAVLYMLLGWGWIVVSDHLLQLLPEAMQNTRMYSTLQTVKGLFWITLTGVIIFMLARAYIRLVRKAERDHEQLFADHPHPMWVYDRESLRFLEVNNAAVQIYGYSRAEFKSMTILDIRPEDDRARVRASVQGLKTGYHDAGTWEHIKRDGQRVLVEIHSHPVLFRGQIAQLVAVEDVTARKEAEAERLRLIDALQHSNRSLIEFNQLLSHHLRIPISNLMGLLPLLQSGTEAARAQVLRYLEQSAGSLDQISRDMAELLLAPLEAGQGQEKPFGAVLDAAAQPFGASLAGGMLALRCEPEAARTLPVRDRLLMPIVRKLIGIADRYREAHAAAVCFRLCQTSPQQMQLLCVFSGVDIPAPLAGAMAPGAHEEAMVSYLGGEGLGMYMLTTYLHLMGGRVVRSDLLERGWELEILLGTHTAAAP